MVEIAKPYTVTMPDGSTRQVLANSQAAANNNMGLPASGAVVVQAPTSSPAQVSGSIPNYTPAPSVPFNPQASTAVMNAAGYLDSPSGRAAYAAGSAPPVGGTYAGVAVPVVQPGGAQMTNLDANQQLLNNAEKQAYQAYLNSKLNLDTDDLAFRKATQAFQNTITAAGLTGTYNGAPTMAAQQQKFAQDVSLANLTGTYNGQPTEAARQANNQTAVSYLNLISSLKGPSDYGSYLRTIGSTPGGLKDLVSSASGQYVPATGATTGVQPTAATLGSVLGNINGQGTSYSDFAGAAGGLPAPNQIAPAAWNAYTDTQKKLLMSLYGTQGYLPTDVTDLYNQSLPRYGTTAGTTGSVRL